MVHQAPRRRPRWPGVWRSRRKAETTSAPWLPAICAFCKDRPTNHGLNDRGALLSLIEASQGVIGRTHHLPARLAFGSDPNSFWTLLANTAVDF